MSPNPANSVELVESQRHLSINRLAAGVAHEFNNVLQIVSGYVTFARESLPADCAARQDLDQALEAADRAARLSSRLLQFARAEDDDSGTADANDAVAALQLLLRPIIGEDIGVEVELRDGVVEAAAGDASLRQALLNLCVNARDAMPRGGVLRLVTDVVTLDPAEEMAVGEPQAGRYVQIMVEDTGEGMDSQVLEKVFEPFYSTKAPGEGTGLGLAMVAEFVEQAGGGVRVASQQGVGTRFDLYLPEATAGSGGSRLAKELGLPASDVQVVEAAV